MLTYVKLILDFNETLVTGTTGHFRTDCFNGRTNKVRVKFDPDCESLFIGAKIKDCNRFIHKDYFKIITLEEYNKSKFSLRTNCQICGLKYAYCINPIYNAVLCHNCRGPDIIASDTKVLDYYKDVEPLRSFDEPWPY